MKIEELIEKLEKIKKEHGNIEVLVCQENKWSYNAKEITFEKFIDKNCAIINAN